MAIPVEQTHATTSGGLIKTSTQLSPEQLRAVDVFAERQTLSRASALRILIQLGLRAQQKIDQITEVAV